MSTTYPINISSKLVHRKRHPADGAPILMVIGDSVDGCCSVLFLIAAGNYLPLHFFEKAALESNATFFTKSSTFCEQELSSYHVPEF